MPAPLETVKQQFNFDAKLADVILNQCRQPKQIEVPEMEQLIARVRQEVNPKMIARADQWPAQEGADLGSTAGGPQQGDLRFKPTQEFMALLLRLVQGQHGEQPSRKEARRRAKQLKTEIEKGVANIKVKRRRRR